MDVRPEDDVDDVDWKKRCNFFYVIRYKNGKPIKYQCRNNVSGGVNHCSSRGKFGIGSLPRTCEKAKQEFARAKEQKEFNRLVSRAVDQRARTTQRRRTPRQRRPIDPNRWLSVKAKQEYGLSPHPMPIGDEHAPMGEGPVTGTARVRGTAILPTWGRLSTPRVRRPTSPSRRSEGARKRTQARRSGSPAPPQRSRGALSGGTRRLRRRRRHTRRRCTRHRRARRSGSRRRR